jgi:hypothetical protein
VNARLQSGYLAVELMRDRYDTPWQKEVTLDQLYRVKVALNALTCCVPLCIINMGTKYENGIPLNADSFL